MTNISTKWAVEQVPDDAYLFVRVHKSKIEQKNAPTLGIPKAGAFKNTPETGPDLSSDWNKYSTPQQSREQIGKEYRHGKEEFKNPSDFYIVSFKVQDIFDLDLSKKIEHSPRQDNFPDEIIGSPWNRSHCSIIGDDAEEKRVRMVDIAKWEISPPEYNPS